MEYDPDADRVFTCYWEIDLSDAGSVPFRKKRPTGKPKQKLVRFLEREGEVERFAFQQTIPHPGAESAPPPSRSQRTAVLEFFGESPESAEQAQIMLSARDFAERVAKYQRFPVVRRDFLWLCATAYILSDTVRRLEVRAWDRKAYSQGWEISVGIANHRVFKSTSRFIDDVIRDLRIQGAATYG